MKLHLDPLPAMRESAEKAINDHFNRLAYEAGQCDAEHAAKRAEAQRIGTRDGSIAGAVDAPRWFSDAAAIEGVDVREFAEAILAKPDEAAERGNARRRAIVAVRKAQNVGEIERALADLGIS